MTSAEAVHTGIIGEGLTKRYGAQLALDGLHLDVAPGEIFGLIGPNGAGKTTTLRILAGLLTPDTGRVVVGGLDMARKSRAARRRIGYMPEDFGLYDDLFVWEYLDFFGDCYGLSVAERRAVTADLLELVDLSHKRDEPITGLSRGMRQRLCLAHALIHDPLVLILDEPASGLDPRARVEFREILKTLASLGKAIILSSHILSELAEICTRVGIMHQGKLIAAGTVADITVGVMGRPFAIQLAPDADLDAALMLTRAARGVASANLLDSEDERFSPAAGPGENVSHEIRLDFLGDATDAAELLRSLVTAGYPVVGFGEPPGNLEHLFLALTAPMDDSAPHEAARTEVAV